MKIKVARNSEGEFFVERWDETVMGWKFWLPHDTYDFREHSTYKSYYSSVAQATAAEKRKKKKLEREESEKGNHFGDLRKMRNGRHPNAFVIMWRTVKEKVSILFCFPLQFLALMLLFLFAFVAMVWWLMCIPIRYMLSKEYREYSYYFHPLGGDHYETWNPFRD